MAGSVNKVILIGRLGKDPEVRSSQAGGKIVSFSVATCDQWTDKQSGERQERTEWHRVVIFNDQIAGVVERFLSKGSMVHLEGALQTRKWTDNAGVERYSTEVVLARFRGELTLLGDARGNGDEIRQASRRREPAMAGTAGSGSGGDLDDDIPFAACWQ
jgi:single-strand DNA-binding protein